MDLRGADLHKAVLREAIADLTTWWPDEHFDPKKHDVRGLPNLEGADLRSTYLRREDFTGSACGGRPNAFTEWPEGFDWRQAGVIMDDEPRKLIADGVVADHSRVDPIPRPVMEQHGLGKGWIAQRFAVDL